MTGRGYATIEFDDAIAATLTVDSARVRLRAPGVDVQGSHAGIPRDMARQLDALRRHRTRRSTSSFALDTRDASPVGPPPTAGGLGQLLAAAFLPAPIATGLAALVREAEARHIPLRLGVRVAGDVARLPWEMLRLPGSGRPLAQHELIRAYRQVDALVVTPSAGPLRILVAISSPLAGGGAPLDYERELRNVLAAVRGARASRAQVRIVHFATTAAIRAALREAPVHVLHLSGHGGPGVLELEDEDGDARVVTAERFVAEAIPPGLMPPVVALAACHTDVAAAAGDASFAVELIARGTGVVIATETSISDVYATRVFARVYGRLATEPDADVVAAVADARVEVQRELVASDDERDHRLAALDEWSVLTVLSGPGRVPLVDSRAPLRPWWPQAPVSGVLRRDVGEVVGRRREQRRWPIDLLSPAAAGIVVHGIGGVGKTTLVDELCARVIERDPDRITVTVVGQVSGGQLLDTIGVVLASRLKVTAVRGGPDDAVLWALRDIADGELAWPHRLDALLSRVFAVLPVLLVLDNFEDNLAKLAGELIVEDELLAELLARISTSPGRCRLLVTCRYRFTLPRSAERVLSFEPLGPLSLAETWKLAWSLPELDRLDPAELAQVWRAVGGHPRCLEYVDALLGAGRGRFPDVTLRLAEAVRRRLEHAGPAADIDAYFAGHARLDAALAEVATLAADDVLLDVLLDDLARVPGAHRLLIAASVYRVPVDRTALDWPAGADGETVAALHACIRSSLVTDIGGGATFVHRWTAADLTRRWTGEGRVADLIDAHRRAAGYWRQAESGADEAGLREAHHHYAAAVDLGDEASQPDLARAAGALELHLGQFGRRQEALHFSEQAVRIRRALHDTDPDQHPVNFAVTLDRHASRLADMGRPLEALPATEEAVAIYRRLAADDPGSFAANLAVCLGNLGNHLGAAGRWTEALAASDEAVDTLRTLGAEPALALALNNRANQLSTLGRPHEALALCQEAVALYRRLVAGDPAANNPDLAMALLNLASDLGKLGRWDQALPVGEEAVALYRELALDNPGAYEPGLAQSLNNLGARLSDLGRWEQALLATEESVAIKRQLAWSTPGAFEIDLVAGLNNLSVDLSMSRRWADALAVSEEAVAVYRRLHAVNPAGSTPGLAEALDSLGHRFASMGRWDEALATTGEAVTIRRSLAGATPEAFDSGLAASLHNLGVRYATLAQPDEALTAAAEAVRIYRRLALVSPGPFDLDLAAALSNLSEDLAAVGQDADALTAVAEAVEIYRRLIPANPEVIEASLAGTLNSLSNRLADADRPQEALAAITEAVDLLRRIAVAQPDVFEAELPTVLTTLANRLAAADRPAEAAAADREAVAISRRLVETNPEGFEPELARALTNLAVDLLSLGELEEALATAEEAVARLRRLVRRDPGVSDASLALVLRYLSMIRSRLGHHEESLAPADEAVSIYRRTGSDDDLATALISRANRLRENGRPDEAETAQREAKALRATA